MMAPVLPTPYTLQTRAFDPSGTDAYGNPVETWKPAVDWKVHAYASGANVEPEQADRDMSEVLWTVYAPADENVPGARDLVVIDGTEYKVEGDPRDYSHDPWVNRIGGVVVYLKDVDG